MREIEESWTLPPAEGLCTECLQKPIIAQEDLIVCYCEHNLSGALMLMENWIPSGRWQIWTPVSAKEFADIFEADEGPSRGLTEEALNSLLEGYMAEVLHIASMRGVRRLKHIRGLSDKEKACLERYLRVIREAPENKVNAAILTVDTYFNCLRDNITGYRKEKNEKGGG
ncbi:MAG: hypothetical protein QY316_06320 [Thermodesulfobacteriota bacterium]|nr:MAG: hypothetical protein QY316_06320 [Thermodesulfobacteriota bacterium]